MLGMVKGAFGKYREKQGAKKSAETRAPAAAEPVPETVSGREEPAKKGKAFWRKRENDPKKSAEMTEKDRAKHKSQNKKRERAKVW